MKELRFWRPIQGLIALTPGRFNCAVGFHKVFEDAAKTPLGVIILDDLERILSYVDAGPNFSNPMLQALLVMVNKPPKVHFSFSCDSMCILCAFLFFFSPIWLLIHLLLFLS